MGFGHIDGFEFERIEDEDVAGSWGDMIRCWGRVRCVGVEIYWRRLLWKRVGKVARFRGRGKGDDGYLMSIGVYH